MQSLTLAAAIALAAGFLPLLLAFGKLRHTTLLAPWCWACASCILLFVSLLSFQQPNLPQASSVEPAATSTHENRTSASQPTIPNSDFLVRYLIAIFTLLPGMAVLGAKRPQHTAWHLIVVSLWVILAWPALEAYLHTRTFELHTQKLRASFLLVLLLVQWSNWCATRYFLAITLLTASQVALLWQYFPWSAGIETASIWEWGCLGVGLTLFVAWWSRRTANQPNVDEASCLISETNEAGRLIYITATRYNLVWRDFRDMFGVVWSLRVMERVNETARLQNWGYELAWHGMIEKPSSESLPPDQLADQIDQCWQTMLRRFVSPAWIAARLQN